KVLGQRHDVFRHQHDIVLELPFRRTGGLLVIGVPCGPSLPALSYATSRPSPVPRRTAWNCSSTLEPISSPFSCCIPTRRAPSTRCSTRPRPRRPSPKSPTST